MLCDGIETLSQETRQKLVRLEVALEDLDRRTNTEDRIEPLGELCEVQIGIKNRQVTHMA